eukprot:scaffold276757_cov20-Tisochrysis_lutea.AAC.1
MKVQTAVCPSSNISNPNFLANFFTTLCKLQALEAEKQEKAAAEEREKAKKKVFGVVRPVSTLERLRNTLVTMKK